jgi:hypothetical protein
VWNSAIEFFSSDRSSGVNSEGMVVIWIFFFFFVKFFLFCFIYPIGLRFTIEDDDELLDSLSLYLALKSLCVGF